MKSTFLKNHSNSKMSTIASAKIGKATVQANEVHQNSEVNIAVIETLLVHQYSSYLGKHN